MQRFVSRDRIPVLLAGAILCLAAPSVAKAQPYVGGAFLGLWEQGTGSGGEGGGTGVGGAFSAGKGPGGGWGAEVGVLRTTEFEIDVDSSGRLTSRHTTLSLMASRRHTLGQTFDLVYMGVVMLGFQERTYRFEGSSDNDSLYAGPAFGLDGRLRLTESLRLVPGVRVHVAVGGGGSAVTVLPMIGLQWMFNASEVK